MQDSKLLEVMLELLLDKCAAVCVKKAIAYVSIHLPFRINVLHENTTFVTSSPKCRDVSVCYTAFEVSVPLLHTNYKGKLKTLKCKFCFLVSAE